MIMTEIYKLARPLLQGVPCQIINGQAQGVENKMVKDLCSGMPQFKGEIIVGNPVSFDCKERTLNFLEDENWMQLFVFWIYDIRTTDNYALKDRLEMAQNMVTACGPIFQFVDHDLITNAEELAEYIKRVVSENYFPGIVLREPYGTFGTYDEEIPKESLKVQ
jgi:hypothetical protein